MSHPSFSVKFRRLTIHFFNLALTGAILWAHVLIFIPEDVEDIKGRKVRPNAPRDLLNQVGAAIVDGQPFECSEEALNQYLKSILNVREDERFKNLVEFKGLNVRLNEGDFDLVLERKLVGLPVTSSVRFVVTSTPGGLEIKVSSGRFGRLHVPGGFMNLLRPGLMNIGKTLEAEKQVLSRPLALTVKDGWLRLDPRS